MTTSRPHTIGAGRIVVLVAALVGTLVLVAPAATLLIHNDYAGMGQAVAQTAAGPLPTSLVSAAVALVGCVAVGTPLAYWLARTRSAGWRRLVEAVLYVPLLMPPLVVGLVLIYLLGPLTPLGQFAARLGIGNVNSLFALILASFYEAVPYYVFAAVAAFERSDRLLERTAESWGRPPAAVFRRVTLPAAAPGLAVGVAMAWARAIGAFGAAIIVAYHPTGLPVDIYTQLEELGLPAAFPVALILLVAALPLPLAVRAVWRDAPA